MANTFDFEMFDRLIAEEQAAQEGVPPVSPKTTAQSVSDVFSPVRKTLGPAAKLPLGIASYLQDMAAAGGYGLYGAASDVSGLGASALGFPELGEDLFDLAQKSYGRAGEFVDESTDYFLPEIEEAGEIKKLSPELYAEITGNELPTIDPLEDFASVEADEIQAYLDNLGVLGGRGKVVEKPGERAEALKTPAQKAEDFRAAEENIATAQGMRVTDEVVDDAFISAMQDFNKSAGKEDAPAKGETREEALARYKKEFSDATGIDASGKVDKSKALMAFGLALMQNKAGKGFNISKMLQSVGSAGEAAQPMLDKAIDRANAAKLAAGKYALEAVRSDESSRAALAKEARAANRAYSLKLLELSFEADKSSKDDLKLKNIDKNEIISGVKIGYGTSGGEVRLARPSADAALVSNAWNKYSKGEENVNKMLGIAEELSQENAPAFKTVGDRIKKQLGNFGLRDPKIDFGKEGVSDEDRFNAMRLSVINEMKRLIIQESQVSDYDRQMLDASFGDINMTSSPSQVQYALNEMLAYFGSKKSSLVAPLQHMYDPSYYVNDGEYNRTVDFLSKNLETPFVSPVPRNEDGSTTTKPIATVDLTGG